MVKITHLSDTHGIHNKMSFSGGDILIHTGDIFDYNQSISEEEIMKWFNSLPYTYKIIVKGNHDYFKNDNTPNNVFILDNQILEVLGLKIYGVSAVLPEENSTKRYNVATERDIENSFTDYNFDILATHGSPKGILDIKFGNSIGSKSLFNFVNDKKPAFHLFGHTHHAKGIMYGKNTTFINNSIIRYLRKMDIQSSPINIEF